MNREGMLTVILVALLTINTNDAYLFSFSPHSFHMYQPSIRSHRTHSPISHFTLPDQLFTQANQYRVDRKPLLNPGQKWQKIWAKRIEEDPFKRKANLRGGQERDISIEENLVASVNVYQAMKTKEDVHRAMKTKEVEAVEINEAMKAKERKNYFDHLAFMSRLTGK